MGGILRMNLINEIFIEVIKEGGLELIKKSDNTDLKILAPQEVVYG